MNKKTILINLIFCSAMHGINHYLLIFYKPMYIQMSGYFGVKDVSGLTVRMTMIYAGYGIANFISGILSRKYSRKKILSAGMLLMSAASMLVFFIPSDSFNMMVILVFLMGLSGGVYHPAANTFVTCMYEEKMGHAIGILSIGSAIGFILAPFIGEYIGNKLIGFKSLFLISGSAGFIFSIMFIIFVKEEFHHTGFRTGTKPFKNSNISPALFVLVLALLCIPVTLKELSNWSFYEITPFWVNYGFSKGISVSLIQSMQYLPSIFIQPFVGRLCDRFGSSKMVMITFFACGAGIALFSISNIFVLWIAMIIFGAGMGSATVAGETFMAGLSNAKNRPLIYGVVLSAGLALGGTLGGVSGWVVDIFGKESVTGYNVWFILSGLLVVVSTFIFLIISRIRK